MNLITCLLSESKRILGEYVNMTKRCIGMHNQMFFYYKDYIKRVINDYKYEQRLGISTVITKQVKNIPSLYKDENRYIPVSYYELNKIIDCLKFKKNDVFVDIGCGKGRVILLVSQKKIKKVIGVEIDKRLVEIAKKNLDVFKLKNTKIEIIYGDAAKFNFKEGTIFFIFNPFGWKTLNKVLNNIKKSLMVNPRKIRIIYHNPTYRILLDAADWLKPMEKINEIGLRSTYAWTNK